MSNMNWIETGGKVQVHDSAVVEPTAVLVGPCWVGENSYIGHHAVIGAPPQYKGFYPDERWGLRAEYGTIIGNDVCVRELTQVHQGIQRDTVIAKGSLIMAGCHIAHDSYVGKNCTIGSFTIFGGHTCVDDDVTFGQGVVTHPWVIIGMGAMIGLNSSVLNDVLPHQKVAGSPARLLGRNTGPNGPKQGWWEDEILDEDVWNRYNEYANIRIKLKAHMKETYK